METGAIKAAAETGIRGAELMRLRPSGISAFLCAAREKITPLRVAHGSWNRTRLLRATKCATRSSIRTGLAHSSALAQIAP